MNSNIRPMRKQKSRCQKCKNRQTKKELFQILGLYDPERMSDFHQVMMKLQEKYSKFLGEKKYEV